MEAGILHVVYVQDLFQDGIHLWSSRQADGRQVIMSDADDWSTGVRMCVRRHYQIHEVPVGKAGQVLTGLCLNRGAGRESAETFSEAAARTLSGIGMLYVPGKALELLADHAAERAFSLDSFSREDEVIVREWIARTRELEEKIETALFGGGGARGACRFSHAVSVIAYDMEEDCVSAFRASQERLEEAEDYDDYYDDHEDAGDAEDAEDAGGADCKTDIGSVTLYYHVAADLGLLWKNLDGEALQEAIGDLINGLHDGRPLNSRGHAVLRTSSSYVRVLVHRGPANVICGEQPVRFDETDRFDASCRALDAAIAANEGRQGSLYGKLADVAVGHDHWVSDEELADIVSAVDRELRRQ